MYGDRDEAVQRLYDDSFRRKIDQQNRVVEKERLEMEHVRSRPKLVASQTKSSYYYDQETES